MKKYTIPFMLALCLCVAAQADDQYPVEKTAHTVKKTANRAGGTIEHGAEATGRTLKHATQATERTVGKELKKTGNSLQRAGDK